MLSALAAVEADLRSAAEAVADAGRRGGLPPLRLLRAVAAAADPTGARATTSALGGAAGPDDIAVVASHVAAAGPDIAPWHLLGAVYESTLSADGQRRAGAYYTPPCIADGVVRFVTDQLIGQVTAGICDPAVGGGAMLLAAAEHLYAGGVERRQVVEQLLWGADLDPLAVQVTRAALALWAGPEGDWVDPGSHIVAVDALAGPLPAVPAGRFDAVVGNPPFLGQLRSDTARGAGDTARVRERFGAEVVAPYTDAASLFLLAALDLVRPEGCVGLLQPQSVLASRDAGPVRARLVEDADLVGVWLPDEPVFAASVDVCALIVRRSGGRAGVDHEQPGDVPRVERRQGSAFLHQGDATMPGTRDPGWSLLLSDLRGIPRVELEGSPTLADWVEATAGFRQQYYGVAAHVIEAPDGPLDAVLMPLVTCGAIDPATCRWGDRLTRFARRRWSRPAVDLQSLEVDPALHRWAIARRGPKVLVATQTRVVEAVVDEVGHWYPSTPVVAVTVRPGGPSLWEVAAALSSPPVAAWTAARFGGAALSSDALKLSARQVLDLPRPPAPLVEVGQLFRAAAVADATGRREALLTFGAAACEAYGSAGGVLDWWAARLPVS